MIGLPIPSTPMVDPGTGIVTQVWYDYLSGLLTRVGGPVRDAAGDALAQSLLGALSDPADLVDLSGVQGTADAAMTLALLGEVGEASSAPDALMLLADCPAEPTPPATAEAMALLDLEPPDAPDPAAATLLAMALADLL